MPKISKTSIEDVKARTSLVDVFRQFTPSLKRKGKGWWACCPFHNEKTPSLHIVEDKGYYHCFGCGAHGGAIDLVQHMRGGTFVEAVEYLAETSGVTLQYEKSTTPPAVRDKYEKGYAALDKAKKLFVSQLNGKSLEYCDGRGLTAETVQEFGVGFAKDGWDATMNELISDTVDIPSLLDTGLIGQSDSGKHYDRFRGRLMFPIENERGQVVGFGGRILEKNDNAAKYLNSPETDFFHKSKMLYNLNRAREHVRQQGYMLVVEGYMDAIALWQAGIKTAVAPMGTALTEDQVHLLWRYTDTPFICLDGDEAGQRAAYRSAMMVLPHLKPGKSLKFITMPEGHDPDSFVAEQGAHAFKKLVQASSTLDDIIWRSMTALADFSAPDTRARIEQEIATTCGSIADETVKKHYTSALKSKLWDAVRGKALHGGKLKAPDAIKNAHAHIRDVDAAMCSLMFHEPIFFEKFSDEIADLKFKNQAFNQLVGYGLQFLGKGTLDKPSFDSYLTSIGAYDQLHGLLKSDIISQMDSGARIAYWRRLSDEKKAKQEKAMPQSSIAHIVSEETDMSAWEEMKQKLLAQKQKNAE